MPTATFLKVWSKAKSLTEMRKTLETNPRSRRGHMRRSCGCCHRYCAFGFLASPKTNLRQRSQQQFKYIASVRALLRLNGKVDPISLLNFSQSLFVQQIRSHIYARRHSLKVHLYSCNAAYSLANSRQQLRS